MTNDVFFTMMNVERSFRNERIPSFCFIHRFFEVIEVYNNRASCTDEHLPRYTVYGYTHFKKRSTERRKKNIILRAHYESEFLIVAMQRPYALHSLWFSFLMFRFVIIVRLSLYVLAIIAQSWTVCAFCCCIRYRCECENEAATQRNWRMRAKNKFYARYCRIQQPTEMLSSRSQWLCVCLLFWFIPNSSYSLFRLFHACSSGLSLVFFFSLACFACLRLLILLFHSSSSFSSALTFYLVFFSSVFQCCYRVEPFSIFRIYFFIHYIFHSVRTFYCDAMQLITQWLYFMFFPVLSLNLMRSIFA